MRTIRNDYHWIEAPNVFWTLAEVADSPRSTMSAELVMYLVPATAALVFLFNLPSLAREVGYTRIKTPQRVLEDDAAAAEAAAPSA